MPSESHAGRLANLALKPRNDNICKERALFLQMLSFGLEFRTNFDLGKAAESFKFTRGQ